MFSTVYKADSRMKSFLSSLTVIKLETCWLSNYSHLIKLSIATQNSHLTSVLLIAIIHAIFVSCLLVDVKCPHSNSWFEFSNKSTQTQNLFALIRHFRFMDHELCQWNHWQIQLFKISLIYMKLYIRSDEVGLVSVWDFGCNYTILGSAGENVWLNYRYFKEGHTS